MASGSDNAGTCQDYRMVRVRKRDEKVYVRNQWCYAPQEDGQLEPGGCGLDGGAYPFAKRAGNSLAGFVSLVGRSR